MTQRSASSLSSFLSTLSLRRATIVKGFLFFRHKISIHALLAESDFKILVESQRHNDFYPRSPCGERLFILTITICTASFLSTLSLRRATARRESRQQPAGISIHALLAESDFSVFASPFSIFYFYPRSPCGERRCWTPKTVTPI